MRLLPVALVALLGLYLGAFWNPVRLDAVSYRIMPGPLPAPLEPNDRIAANLQRWFESSLSLSHSHSDAGIVAPEHFTFDPASGDIYFGVHDGRIMRTRVVKDGSSSGGELVPPELVVYTGEPGRADRLHPCGSEESEGICGRPLGMVWDVKEHKLIVADCYLGLIEVDVRARTRRVILDSAGGLPVYFANSVVIGPRTGAIYFTDSTQRWRRRDFIYEVLEGARSGRVIRFDRNTQKATVLVEGVAFANGILVDPVGEEYLLFNELNRARVLRLDLLQKQSASSGAAAAVDASLALSVVDEPDSARARSPEALHASRLLTLAVGNLPGIPDNLAWEQDTSSGSFWIGCGTRRTQPFSLTDALAPFPQVRAAIAALLPKQVFLSMVPKVGLLLRIQMDEARREGYVAESLQDNTGTLGLLTGAYERDGFLYVGAISHDVNFIPRIPWTAANRTDVRTRAQP